MQGSVSSCSGQVCACVRLRLQCCRWDMLDLALSGPSCKQASQGLQAPPGWIPNSGGGHSCLLDCISNRSLGIAPVCAPIQNHSQHAHTALEELIASLASQAGCGCQTSSVWQVAQMTGRCRGMPHSASLGARHGLPASS